METKNTIFREKSMERISSPEDLNDYVRVANPGVWLTLAGVIALLIGFIVWGIYGKLETTVDALAVSDEGQTLCYVREKDVSAISDGMKLILADGTECTIAEVGVESLDSDEVLSDYAKHIINLSDGEWIHPVNIVEELPEGLQAGKIVTESIHPVSFIFNG